MRPFPSVRHDMASGLTVARLCAGVLAVSIFVLSFAPATGPAGRTYATTFALTESPISEGGNWVNGKSTGLDWRDVRTTLGLAHGTQTGAVGYDDSTALLTGAWGPDQWVEATVRSSNQSDGFYEEVELRLRSAISAHRITGYECLFRCAMTPRAYASIVRWNGRLGDFTVLAKVKGIGVRDGDVVRAAIVGRVITLHKNGARVLRATDGTYATGSPGIGFFLQGAGEAANGDFGFTRVRASDLPGTAAPSAVERRLFSPPW